MFVLFDVALSNKINLGTSSLTSPILWYVDKNLWVCIRKSHLSRFFYWTVMMRFPDQLMPNTCRAFNQSGVSCCLYCQGLGWLAVFIPEEDPLKWTSNETVAALSACKHFSSWLFTMSPFFCVWVCTFSLPQCGYSNVTVASSHSQRTCRLGELTLISCFFTQTIDKLDMFLPIHENEMYSFNICMYINLQVCSNVMAGLHGLVSPVQSK